MRAQETFAIRFLLIVYALVNAALYSLLLPLWEGFDEPFHFAYVQQLANGQGFPDPRTARLSREVGVSLLLAPASEGVKRNLPQVTSYAQFFAWPVWQRQEARRQLRAIPADLRWQPSQFLNYEAHHPPLAYLMLALPERLLAGVPLPRRVAILRMLAAAAGSLLLLSGARKLFGQLGLPAPFQAAALFCLLSSQMTWATIAHVANDWLAVPLALWTLVALIRLDASPSLRTAAVAASLLAAGLLTKAYFLAFLPLFAGLCAWRRHWRELALGCVIVGGLAGPWYARNLLRYGDLTGTQESRAGIDLTAVLREAPSMPWPSVIRSSVRTALWCGNNTFLTFSSAALDLTIGVSLAALLLWAASRHAPAEWITLACCASFLAALGYAAVASAIYTHGGADTPSPWYAQVLSAPLLGLALLGASRWRRLGSAVAAFLVLIFGYLLAATYAVKLIPLYGGYAGRTSLAGVAMLYGRSCRRLAADLETASLAPSAVIFSLAAVAIVLVIAQQLCLVMAVGSKTWRS